MCVAIIGGIKGIENKYKTLLKKHGIKKYKIFNTMVPDFQKKIKNVDALILFTNTVSHKLSTVSSKICKKNNICIKRTHSSSLNKLDEKIKEIKLKLNNKHK
ncbi:hypothetical protein OSSY52_15700 [Tepiditoga spiralis]|uniref:DUF2325 domain-containing protein n=1 Tax=Tepiditoga spiralis TaxID=2108365 RepID=A0A7G1GBW2_9BACT|nr:DUF2325 domain-containing protein [Tepiditoga spiralis]BBE31429.1 hypothetical protein OSSY52_15700 [Tepiditoga spiralis]